MNLSADLFQFLWCDPVCRRVPFDLYSRIWVLIALLSTSDLVVFVSVDAESPAKRQ